MDSEFVKAARQLSVKKNLFKFLSPEGSEEKDCQLVNMDVHNEGF